MPDPAGAGAVGADHPHPALRSARATAAPAAPRPPRSARRGSGGGRARPAPPARARSRPRRAAPARGPRRRSPPRRAERRSASQRAWRPASRSSSAPDPAARSRSISARLAPPSPSSRLPRRASASSALRIRPRSSRRSNQSTRRGRGDPGRPQVGEQVRGAPPPDGGLEQGEQPGAGEGPGDVEVGLDGDRDLEPGQHPAESGPAAAGSRRTIAISPGGDVVVEQAGDLGADRLGLGQLAGRGEQRQPAVVVDRLRPRRARRSGARARTGCALRVKPRFGLELGRSRRRRRRGARANRAPRAAVRTSRSSQGRAIVTSVGRPRARGPARAARR